MLVARNTPTNKLYWRARPGSVHENEINYYETVKTFDWVATTDTRVLIHYCVSVLFTFSGTAGPGSGIVAAFQWQNKSLARRFVVSLFFQALPATVFAQTRSKTETSFSAINHHENQIGKTMLFFKLYQYRQHANVQNQILRPCLCYVNTYTLYSS